MAERAARKAKADPEEEVLQVIAAMPKADREIAQRLHRVIRASAPELTPKLYYKQPGYAKDGKVVVFFRGAEVDGERYLSLGFSGLAQLDEGNVWPTSYAVAKLTSADEKRLGAIVKRAAG